VAEVPALENFLNDVRNGHLLENAAVGDAGKKPQPGHDLHLVGGETGIGTTLGEAADEPVEITLALICQHDADSDALTDDVLEGDGVIFGEQVQVKVEQARYSL